jgi:hypothetical protein
MSASSTWLYPFAPSFLSVSRASVALRLGRKPYELGRKSASKIGSSTSFAAICTTRSRTVGIPSGRFFPSAFGMYRRSTATGRYLPARSTSRSSSRKLSTPYSSRDAIVWASTPAAPLFCLTRFHASARTSLLAMRSYNAWKRRSGCRLAATHSRRCSCRTLSSGSCPRGWLGPGSPAMPSRLPALPTRPPQGSFPPAALFCAAFVPAARAPVFGTMTPSDSRCAAVDFATGLYDAPCPDKGNADGSPEFRTPPCTRAAPPAPPGPTTRFGTSVVGVAFAVT